MSRSKYQLHSKGMRKLKRRSFHNGTNRTWLRTRHSIRKKMLER